MSAPSLLRAGRRPCLRPPAGLNFRSSPGGRGHDKKPFARVFLDITLPWDWTLAPRTVKPGHVYVVGDNRSVSMASHQFGQTPVHRIVGALLW